MIYPDALDSPSRTIITGEGGKSPSRFKHVIASDRGLRRLTPIELERLNMFPDNHTKLDGITDTKRRSEERRVGKECRNRWTAKQQRQKMSEEANGEGA